MVQTDVLIIGSGIAGLTYALHLAQERPDLRITIVTKSEARDSNTIRAQGGIAAVTDPLNDSVEKHIEDTMIAGQGFSDPGVVRMVIANASARIDELLEWGVSFDKNQDGTHDLHLEGGHSVRRVLHCKDFTGLEIEIVLLARINKHPNIVIHPYLFAIDLITVNGSTCSGATVLDDKNKSIFPVIARITVLSTGGMGQVFERTTNPGVATGDGVAMAFRAGARIRDMHFVQFHPTAFYQEGDEVRFLISEAVRGLGAHLVDRNKKRFMFKYDSRAELATRDIISEAIETELSNSGDYSVFLDCRHIDPAAFRAHFPTINRYCSDKGLDLFTDLIPVAPAAHYQCGGISVNCHSETNIRHLLAIGECASTGLHGANRLASNSLLEALVFSHLAFCYTNQTIDRIRLEPVGKILRSKAGQPAPDYYKISELKKEVRSVMSKYAGINKSIGSLQLARKILLQNREVIDTQYKKHELSVPLLEARNISQVALLILEHALEAYSKISTWSGMTKVI